MSQQHGNMEKKWKWVTKLFLPELNNINQCCQVPCLNAGNQKQAPGKTARSKESHEKPSSIHDKSRYLCESYRYLRQMA